MANDKLIEIVHAEMGAGMSAAIPEMMQFRKASKSWALLHFATA